MIEMPNLNGLPFLLMSRFILQFHYLYGCIVKQNAGKFLTIPNLEFWNNFKTYSPN